jgi:uncharacterized protein
MVKKFLFKIKKHFLEVLETKNSPHSIAFGFAVGTLIAILPTLGFGILIGLALLLVFKNINKFSMLFSFAVWNPFLLVSFSPLQIKLGAYLLRDVGIQKYKFKILNTLFVYSRNYLLGTFIFAIVFTILSYFIILFLVYKYQKKHFKPLEKEVKELKQVLEI